jgi:hypothetical protein
MSLIKDLELHLRIHLDALSNLSSGVPEGLPAQLAALAPVVGEFEAEAAKIAADPMLSTQGKATRDKAAREAAAATITKWEAALVAGVDRQIGALDAQLAKADPATPPPNDAVVDALGHRLLEFDPIEMEVLYADASDRERLLIELAAERIGRVPRRRGPGGELVWEHILDPERIAAGRAARLATANPAAVAAREDARRIRGIYTSLATAARKLLGE